MDSYAAVFGRLHPLLLHLPIGLMVGVVAMELAAWWRRKGGGAPAGLLWLTAAAAAAAVATGLVLSYEDGYGGRTLDIHLWLGIAFGVAAVAAAVTRSRMSESRPGATRAYRGSLAVALGLMLAAGHFGAAMTHGPNFLFEPLSRSSSPGDDPTRVASAQSFEVPGPASPDGFASVQPIFAQSCNSCHSGSIAKAGLALDSFESLVRGSDLEVLDPSDPAASELLRRIKLPIEDPDHMPPEGRRQLTPEQIQTIEAWVTGGVLASASSRGSEEGEHALRSDAATDGSGAPTFESVPSPDVQAIAALAATLAHVSPVAEGSGLLWVNVSYANPPLEERQIIDLLRPLAANIADLNLADCRVTDAIGDLVASMPHLRRLNLSDTPVTDQLVGSIAGHPALADLVLTRTQVSDAAVESLLAMPGLEHVYLWGTQVTPEAVAGLREARQGLVADAGEFAEAEVLVVEPEPKFTDPAKAEAAPLTASNATCPVSGGAVDARYLIVYEGKVIGFCCANCPTQFWADPAKFADKLKP